MPESPSRIGTLRLVLTSIGVLWIIFVIDVSLRSFHIYLANSIGLVPHSTHGLWGILGAHLLHANIQHILANSIGLLILGLVSVWYSRTLTAWAIVYSAICAGALTWLIAPADSGVHIGASGVLFGLIGFLLINGFVRRSWAACALAILVGLIFHNALPGMLPTDEVKAQSVSWEMHLGGFLGGVLASWNLRQQKPT
ncbi:MAG: rhomboid family intramembrane serine protease [Planctomycetota bacterium]